MALPLIPIMAGLGLGSLAVSGGANLYAQYNQRKMYRQFARGYQNLDSGYRKYLARNGRKINENRALTSYGGQYLKSTNNLENSYASSVGTTAGTLGAGLMMAGKSSRRL